MSPVPEWLAPSAIAEIGQLLRGIKPAVRLHVGPRSGQLRQWARRFGLFTSSDADGYAVVSRDPSTARRVIGLDRKPGRHTLALGVLLGYPSCCSRAAARVGDEGIDGLHDTIVSRRFHGRFRDIDPSRYSRGDALLSHVPCSHRCSASLTLAARVRGC